MKDFIPIFKEEKQVYKIVKLILRSLTIISNVNFNTVFQKSIFLNRITFIKV